MNTFTCIIYKYVQLTLSIDQVCIDCIFSKYCGLFGKELPIVKSCDSLGSVKTKKDLSS